MAEHGVARHAGERVAGGIVLAPAHLVGKVAGRGELDLLLGLHSTNLAGSLVVVEVFMLGLILDVERAEALDGYIAVAFGKDITDLVEDMGAAPPRR